MKRRAFTLIEVMVVLSILAIIAILAYNFFGSTMKEATLKQQATRIYNDLRVLSDATEKYFIDNGSYYAGGSDPALDPLVTSGILKSRPGKMHGGDAWWSFWTTADRGGPTAAADTYLEYGYDGAASIDELCRKYNEMFTSLGAGVPPNAFVAPDRTNATYCSDDTSGEWLFLMFVDPN